MYLEAGSWREQYFESTGLRPAFGLKLCSRNGAREVGQGNRGQSQFCEGAGAHASPSTTGPALIKARTVQSLVSITATFLLASQET